MSFIASSACRAPNRRAWSSACFTTCATRCPRAQNVKVSGFGTFILRDKGQRVGRNPEDRHRSADRAAAGDDLPRQPDHARPDREGLNPCSRRRQRTRRSPDHRRTVAGARRRPAHPALLGDALSRSCGRCSAPATAAITGRPTSSSRGGSTGCSTRKAIPSAASRSCFATRTIEAVDRSWRRSRRARPRRRNDATPIAGPRQSTSSA